MAREKSTKDKKCNKCDAKQHLGNDPGWYTREGLAGVVGANFAALSTVNLMPVGGVGLKTNVGVMYKTLVGCPSDNHDSFMKKVTEMYAEIREKNAGASNYDPRTLGAYIHDLMTVRALYIHACRALRAVRTAQVSSSDSPYYLTGVVTKSTYNDLAKNYANYSNDLKLIGKDLSTLPVPPISMFDREEFLYGRVFADSMTGKASMIAFVPSEFVRWITEDGDGTYTINPEKQTVSDTFSTLLNQIRTITLRMTTMPVMSILRGDLIKAYGYIGQDLSTYVDMPLLVEYNETVLSQIENSNILFGTIAIAEKSVGNARTGTLNITVSGLPTIPQRPSDTEWMINFHSNMTPDSGTLISITRNMAYVSTEGSTTYLRSSGDPILGLEFVTNISETGAVTYADMRSYLENIESTTQSIAEAALRFVANVCGIVDKMPWFWTGKGAERSNHAYVWDIDQWALINRTQLEQMNELAIRSLFFYRAPRFEGAINPGRA